MPSCRPASNRVPGRGGGQAALEGQQMHETPQLHPGVNPERPQDHWCVTTSAQGTHHPRPWGQVPPPCWGEGLLAPGPPPPALPPVSVTLWAPPPGDCCSKGSPALAGTLVQDFLGPTRPRWLPPGLLLPHAGSWGPGPSSPCHLPEMTEAREVHVGSRQTEEKSRNPRQLTQSLYSRSTAATN